MNILQFRPDGTLKKVTPIARSTHEAAILQGKVISHIRNPGKTQKDKLRKASKVTTQNTTTTTHKQKEEMR
jgi:hypothetical protein